MEDRKMIRKPTKSIMIPPSGMEDRKIIRERVVFLFSNHAVYDFNRSFVFFGLRVLCDFCGGESL